MLELIVGMLAAVQAGMTLFGVWLITGNKSVADVSMNRDHKTSQQGDSVDEVR